MSDRERCTSCGAMVPAETGVCEYCGSAVEHDVNVPPPARDRASERIERFDRLAEHPSFDKWMRWRPAESAPRPNTWRSGGFVLLAVGLIVLLGAAVADHGSRFPALIFGVALTSFGARIWWSLPDRPATTAATIRPYSALVVAKRTDVTTGEDGGTSYFVTMEFRSGTRREYDVDGEFYGLVAEDDIGVAYIREGDLLHFKKVDV